MKIKILSIPLLLLVLAAPALAQNSAVQAEKAANIQRLLKLVGADKLQGAMIDQMLGILKPIFASNGQGDEATRKMSNRFSDIMADEFHKIDFGSVSSDLYDKYFSNDEIKGLITFYESPLGQKAIQAMPALTSEAMSRGEKLGELAAQHTMQRMVEEYPDLKKAMQAAQPPK